jgi:hypothetical protein
VSEVKARDQWVRAYMAAALETDQDRLIVCIQKASEAIEQRLKLPIETDSQEYLAIRNAQRALRTLKAERVDELKPMAKARRAS